MNRGRASSKGRVQDAAPAIMPDVVPLLLAWFDVHARDLPWRSSNGRTGLRDPYGVLVSELMLQQTQVSRVVPKFLAFLQRFPTLTALARAPEDDVLAAWTGLGYYRRARLLHACAQTIVQRHGGHAPAEVDQLLDLPGIGRYTAGAIASLAFGRAAPLVDTNVSRVLLRLGNQHVRVQDASDWCWAQATTLVQHAATLTCNGAALPANPPGAWNEALMELGATICTSAQPQCLVCPLQSRCQAAAHDTADQIPLAAKTARRSGIVHAGLLIRDRAGRVLLEQRPDGAATGTGTRTSGLWARLWQIPTLECQTPPASPAALAKSLGLASWPLRTSRRPTHDFVFKTTHRDVRFVVWEAALGPRSADPPQAQLDPTRSWYASTEHLALSSPMRRLLASERKAPTPRRSPRRRAG